MTTILPITKLAVGSVGTDALVCGDPARAAQIAEHLHEVKQLSQNREYHVYQGSYNGRLLTVCSHGVGAPGAAVAFEELIAAGTRRLIRVGTCGGLHPDVHSGDLVVAAAAVDNTGYGPQTVPPGFPAAADVDLTRALRDAAVLQNPSARTGIVLTCDNFYAGVRTPFTPDYQVMAQANVLAVEMECAALFIVGALRGVQTAAVLAVDGNVLATGEQMETYRPHRDVVQTAVSQAIVAALQTAVQQDDDAL